MARYFEFQDAKSDKFWEIELSGNGFTTRWGKRGTNGQSKEKRFADEAEARKTLDKLVAEKLKEGYVERGGSVQEKTSAPPAPNTAAPIREKTSAPPPVAQKQTETSAAELTLDPEDLARVNYRPVDWVRPETAPFDFDACAAKLRKIKIQYHYVNWGAVSIPLLMEKAEAFFWLACMKDYGHETKPAEIIQALKKIDFAALATDAKARKRLLADVVKMLPVPGEAMVPLLSLYPMEELLPVVFEITEERRSEKCAHGLLAPALARVARLLLSGTDLELLRKEVASLVKRFPWENDKYCSQPHFNLAAALGMSELVAPVVASFDDKEYLSDDWHDHYHRPQDLVLGLGSREEVSREMRRLGLRLHKTEYLRGWLAHTGLDELDWAVRSVNQVTNKDEAEALVADFAACVGSSRAVEAMLAIHLGSKAPRQAREWLQADPARTIAGLVPLATGPGRLAEAARSELLALAVQGHRDDIEKAAGSLDEAGKALLRAEVLENPELSATPISLSELPAGLRAALEDIAAAKGKGPAWLSAGELPSILVSGGKLDLDSAALVLKGLSTAGLDNKPAFIAPLKAVATAASLERFALRLFDIWLGAGAPAKDKWAFTATGLLGGDRAALRLAPLIRAWPGEAQHQRAVLGLEVLRAIGTDTALMQLNGIAQKVPFKALKQKAGECMDAIAKDLGLTKAELEDRIVPDCGLDETGTRTFDYGERRWNFVLGPELKPALRGEDGKIRDDLPKPSGKDDPEKADSALADWKLLKKTIRETAKLQALRLESAMVTGRRWKRGDFEALIVRHPLLTHIARLVLWAGYDKNGSLIKTFRLTEERDYADSRDGAADIADCAMIGIIHPLNIPEAEKKAWGELFSDYAIVPPFPQLGRPVFGLEPKEASGEDLTRALGLAFPAPTLVFALEKLGYTRGVAQDAGSFTEHSKQFPAVGVTAVCVYDGNVCMGYIEADEELKIAEYYFVEGMRKPSWGSYNEKKLKLSKVDPVVVSEILYDVSVLASKAR